MAWIDHMIPLLIQLICRQQFNILYYYHTQTCQFLIITTILCHSWIVWGGGICTAEDIRNVMEYKNTINMIICRQSGWCSRTWHVPSTLTSWHHQPVVTIVTERSRVGCVPELYPAVSSVWLASHYPSASAHNRSLPAPTRKAVGTSHVSIVGEWRQIMILVKWVCIVWWDLSIWVTFNLKTWIPWHAINQPLNCASCIWLPWSSGNGWNTVRVPVYKWHGLGVVMLSCQLAAAACG